MIGESPNTDHEDALPLSGEFLAHYYADIRAGFGDAVVDFDPLTGNYVLPDQPGVDQRLSDEANFPQPPGEAYDDDF